MTAENEIRCNKTAIQEVLSNDFDFILNKVYEKKLITKREYNNLINSKINGNLEGCSTHLVDKIMNKTEDYCQSFLQLLQTDDIQNNLPALRNIQWKHRPPPSNKENNVAPIQVCSATEQDDYIPASKRCKQDEEYQLTSKPTGVMLILNNENFMCKNKRNGTAKDADELATVFKWLGFRVFMCKDQPKDVMAQVLKEFASLTDLSKLQRCEVTEWSGQGFSNLTELPKHGDAFVCCVLSHGEKGAVCGTDSELLNLNEITKPFNGSNCTVLNSKPKVFFIQACQGSEKHLGVQADCSTSEDKADESPISLNYIPVGADFLVAMSTVECYVSYRHCSEGSWFIQSLCKQLKAACPRGEDIMAILTRVNHEVSQKERCPSKPGAAKQMPEARNFTLRKRLVFTPCAN